MNCVACKGKIALSTFKLASLFFVHFTTFVHNALICVSAFQCSEKGIKIDQPEMQKGLSTVSLCSLVVATDGAVE